MSSASASAASAAFSFSCAARPAACRVASTSDALRAACHFLSVAFELRALQLAMWFSLQLRALQLAMWFALQLHTHHAACRVVFASAARLADCHFFHYLRLSCAPGSVLFTCTPHSLLCGFTSAVLPAACHILPDPFSCMPRCCRAAFSAFARPGIGRAFLRASCRHLLRCVNHQGMLLLATASVLQLPLPPFVSRLSHLHSRRRSASQSLFVWRTASACPAAALTQSGSCLFVHVPPGLHSASHLHTAPRACLMWLVVLWWW